MMWIGTSFKMNKTLGETLAFCEHLKADGRLFSGIQRFIIPPFTAVRQAKSALAQTDIKVGAQNMHWDDQGAWTGEISPPMLVDCGLDLVELGHSERREHFGETDATVALKVEAAVRHGLTPLICIGETLAEREQGAADPVLKRQVEMAFSRLGDDQKQAPMLLAYEPVWAIGVNGIPATADYADERHARIAEVAEACLGRPVPVLYGGSVNPQNCEELIAQPHINGLFIGRSAWSADGYLDILDRVARATVTR
ncbi:triose-phosphate isomerase [Rhizobium paknamense]|uniref:Triosephosphate isomerase n=1 Tax=Rhizobium paknamense TaxID=1206817 RepID=A0ABU0II56_9HYPH|nr:triose-phosphate isomerase [Rhizobium paknamense]MDQ0457919.1 triosephosphate isomerase [Rhizobium paknamense]